MRHYSHEMHSLLRRTAGPEFGWGEGQNKALEIASAAQDEVEQLRKVLRMYRDLPSGGYGQLLGSGKADEAADRLLGVVED